MSLLIPGTNSIKDTGYNVANSLRFNDGSSDYLTKSFGTTQTSTAKFTVSVWVKRCTLGTRQSIFAAYDGTSAGGDDLEFETDDTLSYNGTGAGANTTSAKFRDPSAWLHIVLARDSSASGASNQVKIYVNGTLQTLSANNGCSPSQFLKSGLNSRIGTNQGASQYFVDMYMAELCVIDGQQLDPTSFGEFDEDSPTVWKPKDVSSLTFGNNGFHLDFEDSSALGNDVSGNNNDFTVNNLTAVDQSTDTCTNNFATLNPLDNYHAGSTLSEGNLKIVTGGFTTNTSTIALASGKWFWEVKVTNSSSEDMIGIRGDNTRSNYDWNESYDFFYNSYGRFYDGSSGSQFVSYGATFGTGDIIGVALDLDSGTNTIQFYKNGAAQGSKNITNVSSTAIGLYNIAVGDYTSGAASTFEINFGSPTFSISSGNADGNGYGNFEYSVPSGYYAVNTKNLTEFG